MTRIDEHFVLKPSISIWSPSASDGLKMRPRPEAVTAQFKNDPVIWVDRLADQIGLADAKNCILLDIAQLKRFKIQNISPAKGGGACYLYVLIFTAEDRIATKTLLMGNYKDLDGCQQKLAEMAGCNVSFLEEQTDV